MFNYFQIKTCFSLQYNIVFKCLRICCKLLFIGGTQWLCVMLYNVGKLKCKSENTLMFYIIYVQMQLFCCFYVYGMVHWTIICEVLINTSVQVRRLCIPQCIYRIYLKSNFSSMSIFCVIAVIITYLTVVTTPVISTVSVPVLRLKSVSVNSNIAPY